MLQSVLDSPDSVGGDLREKLGNPVRFQWAPGGGGAIRENRVVQTFASLDIAEDDMSRIKR